MAIWDIKEIYNLQRSNGWAFKGDRCVFAGGSSTNVIDFMSAAAGGTAADFGDLTAARGTMQDNYGTHTRGIFAGGSNLNTIDFVTIATTGNATDYGDLTQTRRYVAGGGNATRGIYGGGISPNPSNGHYNIIEFLTGASTGNTADFGDLTQTLERLCSLSSPTRQVWAAGAVPGDTVQNTIQSVQTATMGNATDFGDLGTAKYGPMGVSNEIRGLVCGGNAGAPGHADFNHIEMITFATAGNASDFGDLTGDYLASGSASAGTGATRGIVGHDSPDAGGNDMIQISTTGNATDFGDISVARSGYAGVSNGHGGLGLDDVQRPSVTYMPGSGRGIVMGGYNSPGAKNTIELINITTLGNSSDFGDMFTAMSFGSANSSLTRMIMQGGYTDALTTESDTIQYVEMASQGNGADFGNLLSTRANSTSTGSCSTTRGLSEGGGAGGSSVVNEIEYITMASVGNGTDFGNLTVAREVPASCSSSTRGVTGGGAAPGESNVMDYVTIASTGDSTDFGDLTEARARNGALSSSTRGVFSGGDPGPSLANIIDYITIASTGDATDFGDLLNGQTGPNGISNNVRGVFCGGRISPNNINVLQFITIASTGNAQDFGDLSAVKEGVMCGSDSHGGLQA